MLHAAALPPSKALTTTVMLHFTRPEGQPGVAASAWKTEEYKEWCIKRPLEKKDHSDKT